MLRFPPTEIALNPHDIDEAVRTRPFARSKDNEKQPPRLALNLHHQVTRQQNSHELPASTDGPFDQPPQVSTTNAPLPPHHRIFLAHPGSHARFTPSSYFYNNRSSPNTSTLPSLPVRTRERSRENDEDSLIAHTLAQDGNAALLAHLQSSSRAEVLDDTPPRETALHRHLMALGRSESPHS